MTNDTSTNAIGRNTPGFAVGLITGGIVGAVLALAFAPRAGAELRRDVANAATKLGAAASERYQDVTSRVANAVGPFSHKAQALQDDVVETVASGVQDVARFATSAKS